MRSRPITATETEKTTTQIYIDLPIFFLAEKHVMY